MGRFAPSPSGPLHLGSLYAALASFLDARKLRGQWLVRIDDIDTPRNVAGAADSILKTLETFGLTWDGDVYYQSRHLEHYRYYLDLLKDQELLYPCLCSRKTLTEIKHSAIYPGLCRNRTFPEKSPHAVRIRVDAIDSIFNDRLQGTQSENLATQHGDFILRRKDAIFSYQFTVVIDDHLQGVTDIVRGVDLLDSTIKQIHLQQKLDFKQPSYMHVPLITDSHGIKLSKQSFARPVATDHPPRVIFSLLELLKQAPPQELADASLSEILDWAINHWQPGHLSTMTAICPAADLDASCTSK
ncbi:MAG: tRNA glutamyl-Q(34) synthetase GluQRS [Gammaproteobacteria bacterium HGW-Gammaproteobacteria-10]|nr:MAG: tRNA glutamyl-Q(34) synthetase GluQRS [Gammaproteobacteria bacterium HGW-Gammaproteobacteria-10]